MKKILGPLDWGFEKYEIGFVIYLSPNSRHLEGEIKTKKEGIKE